MRNAFIAAVIACTLATPALAEDPPAAAVPPPATAAPPQAETGAAEAKPGAAPSEPSGGVQVEAPTDPKKNNAAKLAGMIRFVTANCPEAKPDFERFKRVIAAMGVDIKELEEGPLLIRSGTYIQAYEKDKAESCKRAFEHFGESGKTIPGLIARATP